MILIIQQCHYQISAGSGEVVMERVRYYSLTCIFSIVWTIILTGQY